MKTVDHGDCKAAFSSHSPKGSAAEPAQPRVSLRWLRGSSQMPPSPVRGCVPPRPSTDVPGRAGGTEEGTPRIRTSAFPKATLSPAAVPGRFWNPSLAPKL